MENFENEVDEEGKRCSFFRFEWIFVIDSLNERFIYIVIFINLVFMKCLLAIIYESFNKKKYFAHFWIPNLSQT